MVESDIKELRGELRIMSSTLSDLTAAMEHFRGTLTERVDNQREDIRSMQAILSARDCAAHSAQIRFLTKIVYGVAGAAGLALLKGASEIVVWLIKTH